MKHEDTLLLEADGIPTQLPRDMTSRIHIRNLQLAHSAIQRNQMIIRNLREALRGSIGSEQHTSFRHLSQERVREEHTATLHTLTRTIRTRNLSQLRAYRELVPSECGLPMLIQSVATDESNLRIRHLIKKEDVRVLPNEKRVVVDAEKVTEPPLRLRPQNALREKSVETWSPTPPVTGAKHSIREDSAKRYGELLVVAIYSTNDLRRLLFGVPLDAIDRVTNEVSICVTPNTNEQVIRPHVISSVRLAAIV